MWLSRGPELVTTHRTPPGTSYRQQASDEAHSSSVTQQQVSRSDFHTSISRPACPSPPHHPKWLGRICSRKTPVAKSVASAIDFSEPVRNGPVTNTHTASRRDHQPMMFTPPLPCLACLLRPTIVVCELLQHRHLPLELGQRVQAVLERTERRRRLVHAPLHPHSTDRCGVKHSSNLCIR